MQNEVHDALCHGTPTLIYASGVCSEFVSHTTTESALYDCGAPGMARGEAVRCRRPSDISSRRFTVPSQLQRVERWTQNRLRVSFRSRRTHRVLCFEGLGRCSGSSLSFPGGVCSDLRCPYRHVGLFDSDSANKICASGKPDLAFCDRMT